MLLLADTSTAESWREFGDWLALNWTILAPLALGFLAVWWLMPQAKAKPVDIAVVIGLLALWAGSLAVIQPTGYAIHDFLFSIFGGMTVIAAVCMIAQRKPIYGALWFALVILSVCGLFLLLSAPFLAAATIIVYAGAIIVTFLFVIMLAQQGDSAIYDIRSQAPALSAFAGFLMLGGLLFVFQQLSPAKVVVVADASHADHAHAAAAEVDHAHAEGAAEETPPVAAEIPKLDRTRDLGRSLFVDYLWAVELAGTLLMVAAIGAIAIAPQRVASRMEAQR